VGNAGSGVRSARSGNHGDVTGIERKLEDFLIRAGGLTTLQATARLYRYPRGLPRSSGKKKVHRERSPKQKKEKVKGRKRNIF